jgi:hypothetical protein
MVRPVRDCGRFLIKYQEKVKRITPLRLPLKPLLAIPHVVPPCFIKTSNYQSITHFVNTKYRYYNNAFVNYLYKILVAKWFFPKESIPALLFFVLFYFLDKG